ncbi:hypothetical protein [Paucibacter sp. B51]|uniref:hypothetical protein n=1 Tax=Paucibacter sp. B51 TaxID=2993315 RepID=UPI0022EBF9B9|nr:hypothetical protein [Paucibacter sp. B51]
MNSSTLWFRSLPAALALLSGLLCAPAQAADPAPAKPAPAPEAPAAAAADGVADARVTVTVIEDDSTRIEETRVRGQTQKVTVQSKNSKLPSYEIIMGDGSRDLSAGPGSTRGAAGKRVWNVFNF